MSDWSPNIKDYAATTGGSLAVVVISVMESYHVTVTGTLAAAITTLCSAGIAYLHRNPPGGSKSGT